MRKKLKISIALVLVTVLSAGLTYALITIEKPVTHKIEILGTYNFQLFKDEECTQEFEPAVLNYGQVHRDATQKTPIPATFWVKNTGNDPIYATWNTTDLPSGWSLINTNPYTSNDNWNANAELEFQPGDTRCCKFTVYFDLTSYPIGEVSWTTTFYAHD
jgi:archaellum component FlaG (FlaF/FlaG flagellin family)